MRKSKWWIPSLLILAIAVVAGLGLAGCAKKTSEGQNSSAPAVTTGNSQTSGSSGQQQAQTNGQQPAQSGQQQAPTSVQITTQSGQQQTQAKGKSVGSQQMQASMKKALSGLVSKGTITQDQADKIVQAFTSNKPGQGQAQGGGNGPLNTLVANGTLTQSQADAVMQVLPQFPNGSGGPAPGQANNQ